VSNPLDPAAIDAIAIATVLSGLPFDICCLHTWPERGTHGRCQLWAGHEGEHAVMFVRDGERRVRTWADAAPQQARDRVDYRSLPWARGFPLPAWHEGFGIDE